MTRMALDDAVFLLGESAGKPAHVIALQLFKPPAGADLAEIYESLLTLPVKPVFRKRPVRALTSTSTYAWQDDGLDLDYHVRHLALPPPGRVRELLEIVSLQHGVALDKNRPLWEFLLVGGLNDGRFATAFKTHHALADGITLARHTLTGLSHDPAARDCRPPWAAGGSDDQCASTRPPVGVLPYLGTTAKATAVALNAFREMAVDPDSSVPYAAPNSVLNSTISGARRFAGDKWPLDRLKAIATGAGGTVNDVILAVCGGALRAYLREIEALPERSLIAMVPISLRRATEEHDASGGNLFGSILCDLRTTIDDPAARLEGICRSTRRSKERMAGLSTAEALAVSRLIMSGAALGALLGVTGTPRQPFNLVISNVPATREPLYFNGAELTDIYPISMISEGQAMNITATSYAGAVMFGIVGDRAALPRVQRMLIHLGNAIADLEKSVG